MSRVGVLRPQGGVKLSPALQGQEEKTKRSLAVRRCAGATGRVLPSSARASGHRKAGAIRARLGLGDTQTRGGEDSEGILLRSGFEAHQLEATTLGSRLDRLFLLCGCPACRDSGSGSGSGGNRCQIGLPKRCQYHGRRARGEQEGGEQDQAPGPDRLTVNNAAHENSLADIVSSNL